MNNLECINKLINCFTRLPGVGYKTAERYAYRVIELDSSFVKEFCDSLASVKQNVKFCPTCGTFTDTEGACDICKHRISSGIVCVVKDPKDVIAIEKSGAFTGAYHVLHGVINPLEKKGPNDINLRSLMVRIGEGKIREVILATNPDVEGEATANYIASLIKPLNIRVTRIARGLASGSNLEYADEVTLSTAIQNRTTL